MRTRWTVALAACAWLACAPTATADPLPVDYNFFSGFPAEIANPGGSLPGTNDFSCAPTAEHPNPVILVHGTGTGQQTGWGVYAPLLKNEGYCVFAPTYGALPGAWPISAIGGLGPVPEKGAQFAAFVDEVLSATGAEKVDIVGHSQGTVLPNYYAQVLGGADDIDRYVSLAPLWKGSGPSQFAWPDASYRYAPGITYTNIMTRYDEVVVPYTDGYVEAPNATNIVVQDTCDVDFSEHAGIVGSPRAAAFVLNALDPAHPRPVPCEFVPPFTG
ncbi:alpha/beta fold hydrolase [Rhodococcus sp. BP-149]|uniref:esterase/lipase family protein n=1 Tax=unclassified Rhodococcus (in: high G+C Gram-positive bacteria) TaxID=192944 RepID=UPI001C9B7810|nr:MULTISPECIES: alpha/beta fold hydrolase [unclassified Rhodococcus (in: high G+C Gram-positive bacteria)]MBY6676920.1 alpha/beta fold hydrolase [Rhodococcus sp. BP-332]MBY6684933.1 alpha/beta fold hydrolase [Rhodococcus sp. BP-288]MBY6692583.1 alpha/beta fold hydrolase [Rhodococcus sp. BP-188]MBY6698481.1 alpha/beta fold hydrolase [Rhodococcus sp. BP-285]MBY6701160.1 alpha/beta fold hydrolase [Rhodococcus sp. BP-283]